jgi:hypothetical protein
MVEIVVDGTYGFYTYPSVTVSETCADGTYTFTCTSATAGEVFLHKDGVQVSSLSYSWTSKAYHYSSGAAVIFDFGANYFTIAVAKATGGSMNFAGMTSSIFDGAHSLRVPQPQGTCVEHCRCPSRHSVRVFRVHRRVWSYHMVMNAYMAVQLTLQALPSTPRVV